MPNSLIGLEEYVSNIRVVRVPDVSHWFTIEKPELLTQYIREFIQSIIFVMIGFRSRLILAIKRTVRLSPDYHTLSSIFIL